MGQRDPAAAVGQTLTITSVTLELGRLLSGATERGPIRPGAASVRGSLRFPRSRRHRHRRPSTTARTRLESDVLLAPGPAAGIERLPISSVWDLFRMQSGRLGYSAVTVRVELHRRPRVRRVLGPGDGLHDVRPGRPVRRGHPGLLSHGHGPGRRGHDRHRRAPPWASSTPWSCPSSSAIREIGVMKAVGASDGDIKRIFFFESGAIGLLGGAAGLRPRLGHEPGHQPGRQLLRGPAGGRALRRLLRLPDLALPRRRRFRRPRQPRRGHLPGPPGRPRRSRRRPQARLASGCHLRSLR
ncbi:MAG: hypothetical protein MZV63_63195 [Marinilabiliales bacterium]|nr:hypothetical protein [Marinilabiliales bacterium]